MLKRPYDGEHGSPNDPKKPRPNDSGAGSSLAAKIAAAKAKAQLLRGAKSGTQGSQGASHSPSPAPATPGNDALAAIRARVAALKSDQPAQAVQPIGSASQTAANGISKNDKTAGSGKPSSEAPHNPYYVPDDPQVTRTKSRSSRTLLFNKQGKFLDLGSKMRSLARLEQLKKTIAKQARLAGLDQLSERNFMIQAFEGGVEWWDEGLLEEKNYDCIEDPSKVKIDGDDSVITSYVQHPATLPAAQDRRLVEIKPMYLTRKEQSKVRRMRRAEELKEEQAKIRLGLVENPPPKIKRSNMMRVLGETAVAEPSRVEMMVEAQIQERHNKHLEENEARKLTKDQRLEKLVEHQKKDAKKALNMCVFKIDTLASGKHRYQIDHNAKQHALTGLTIFNPRMNLVIVEGGSWALQKYKKLMLHRIKWQEASIPSEAQQEKQERDPQWLKPLEESGELKDLSANRCTLIFEGELAKSNYKRWQSRVCETDGEALECLRRTKLESLWSLALGSD